MRIAFFGGTFDPPHLGHTAVARAAADRFALDQVLWVPAGRQPLKLERHVAAYRERFAMVELACAADCRFAPSSLDAPLADGRANYTADSLRRLRAEQPSATLFSIAGADSFAELGHWRDPQLLLTLSEWIVISRPGFTLAEPRGLALDQQQRSRIHLLDAVHENISATELRARLISGDCCPDSPACRDLLEPAVADYIAKHKLYGSVSA